MEIIISDVSIEKRQIKIELYEDVIIFESLYDNERLSVCEVNLIEFKNALKFLEDNGK